MSRSVVNLYLNLHLRPNCLLPLTASRLIILSCLWLNRSAKSKLASHPINTSPLLRWTCYASTVKRPSNMCTFTLLGALPYPVYNSLMSSLMQPKCCFLEPFSRLRNEVVHTRQGKTCLINPIYPASVALTRANNVIMVALETPCENKLNIKKWCYSLKFSSVRTTQTNVFACHF